jgi:hypothetical protein
MKYLPTQMQRELYFQSIIFHSFRALHQQPWMQQKSPDRQATNPLFFKA